MSQESVVAALLAGIEFDDPRMYDLLNALSTDFYGLLNTLQPPNTVSVGTATGPLLGPPSVQNFTATTFSDNLKFTWSAAALLSSYELRVLSGTHSAGSWATATSILTTSTLSADINPLTIPLVTGTYTFFIKAIDATGTLSTVASILIFTVPTITTSTITATVIGNSVLLYWTAPVSLWAINYYNIFKNGVLQGTMGGTFEAIFESTGGNFTYSVQAVDIVGNVSAFSAGITVVVQNPSDFVLHSSITSTFSGTKTQCATEDIAGTKYLLACINSTESFQDHFINNSWTDPQAQVTAGFPIFIEPAKTTGSYVEVFDFGSIIANIIVVLNWNTIAVVGSVTTATCTIEVSNDNITYSSPVTGTTLFAASVRYVRFTMNFVGADNKSLAYFYNLQCLLNVHFEQDGGTASLVSTDVGGTVVSFNKAFKSVLSITITANSTSAIFTAYDFSSPLNPTTFKAFAYNNAGTRVNATVTWLARGIF